jgi:pyrroline-5-carboxylate reductase
MQDKKSNIIIIGVGNLACSLLDRLDLTNYNLYLIQKNQEKYDQLILNYPKANVTEELLFTTSKEDIVIIAVKPQDFQSVIKYATQINQSIIISVMVGISTNLIMNELSCSKVVRLMPNILSSIGYSSTGIFFSSDINNIEQKNIIDLFQCIGKVYLLSDEKQMSSFVAIASSSPAFLLYFLENMVKISIDLGYNEVMVEEIYHDILHGISKLMTNKKNFNALRSKISSKGGTTEAAINEFKNHQLEKIFSQAYEACINRYNKISNEFENFTNKII